MFICGVKPGFRIHIILWCQSSLQKKLHLFSDTLQRELCWKFLKWIYFWDNLCLKRNLIIVKTNPLYIHDLFMESFDSG